MTNDDRDRLIQRIADKVDEMHSNQKLQADSLARHERTLYGNGQPGLSCRVDQLETRQEECPARAASRIQNKIALAGVLVAFLTLAYFIYKDQAKSSASPRSALPEPSRTARS